MDSFVLVPQRLYTAPKPYASRDIVLFSSHGRVGVNLRDAYEGELDLLGNPTMLPMASMGKARVTLRILVRLCPLSGKIGTYNVLVAWVSGLALRKHGNQGSYL